MCCILGQEIRKRCSEESTVKLIDAHLSLTSSSITGIWPAVLTFM